jgi:thiol:disulfide interchange protein DsbC
MKLEKVMFKNTLALFMLAGLSATVAGAAAAPAPAKASLEETIRKRIEPRLGKDVKIESIKKTPYSGLYEVRAHGDIIYTDEAGEYLIFGQVVDVKTQRNLTKERVDEINTCRSSMRSSWSRATASASWPSSKIRTAATASASARPRSRKSTT